MSRYDVEVTMTLHYTFAIEADDPAEAQTLAMAGLGETNADQQNVEINVELGADRG